MIMIIGAYAALVWLVFFRLKLLPWNTPTKVVVSVLGLGIALTFLGLLNALTPSGRFTVVAPVVTASPVVSGVVAEVTLEGRTRVEEGDLLFALDERPFRLALEQAEAGERIARQSFERIDTAIQRNPGTFSLQQLDQARAELSAASAAMELAAYNLAQSRVLAPAAGEIGSVELRVGDTARAFATGVPLILRDQTVIAGVFDQNGRGSIVPGAEVGLAPRARPGEVVWSTITSVVPATGNTQVELRGGLLGGDNLAGAPELIVEIALPEDALLDEGLLGSVGTATVIGETAGPIGTIGRILLWVGAYVNYL